MAEINDDSKRNPPERTGPEHTDGSDARREYIYKNGVPIIPSGGGEKITLEHIQSIIDEEDAEYFR